MFYSRRNQEQIKIGNTCCHAAKNLSFFRLPSKIINIRIYKTIILRVALYRCRIWSLPLRKERVLKILRIFGPKRDEVTEYREKLKRAGI